MAYGNRTGKIARFKTGYLQREIILHQAKVTDGTDASIHGGTAGFLVGRIVKVTPGANGIFTIASPADVSNPLADGTHIIAQSDNSMRGTPEDCIPTDRYDSRYDGIVKNTTGTDTKAVAVYKIVNTDDIELIEL